MKRSVNTKRILLAIAIVLLLSFGLHQIIFRDQQNKSDISNQDNSNYVSVWDAETASSKKYASYEEMERETENERKKEIEEYNIAIKGTIVEQVQNIEIPSYVDDNKLEKLQNGEVEFRGEKSDDFPEGVFQWSASLSKDIKSFTVSDFNKDGRDDVAHIVGYTGGGSGYFYELTVFVSNNDKLNYLAQESLGDRVVVKNVKYDSGILSVDMITHGEGDNFMGYCCPNVPATIRFKLENNRLVKIDTNKEI